MAKLPAKIEVDLEDEAYTIYDDPVSENLRQEAEQLYDRLEDWMSIYISHHEGFCHEGYRLEVKIKATHIKWDANED